MLKEKVETFKDGIDEVLQEAIRSLVNIRSIKKVDAKDLTAMNSMLGFTKDTMDLLDEAAVLLDGLKADNEKIMAELEEQKKQTKYVVSMLEELRKTKSKKSNDDDD